MANIGNVCPLRLLGDVVAAYKQSGTVSFKHEPEQVDGVAVRYLAARPSYTAVRHVDGHFAMYLCLNCGCFYSSED